MTSSPDISYLGLLLVFLTPGLGGFIFGFDLGATSFVLAMLESPTQPQFWWSTLKTQHVFQGLIVSALSLGGLFGSHIVLFHLAKKIGRRAEIRVCAILYLIGTALNVASGTILRTAGIGIYCLVLGRFIFGLGVGFIMHGAPIYMAEMCPAHIRGSLVTSKEAFIVLGIIVGYSTGNALSANPMVWYALYGVTVLGTIPMLMLTTVVPRSMRWLLMKGYDDEAKESMEFVYKSHVEEEFAKLREQVALVRQAEAAAQESHPHNFMQSKAFLAAIGLVIFQQCSGQPSVISYSTVLFQAAGLAGTSSVYMSIYMIINTSIAVATVDRVGRKFLLRTGCFIMIFALLALSMSFWNYQQNVTSPDSFTPFDRIVILLSMFLYIGAYQIGFGPVTWLIVSEVFPLESRGRATAFLVELNFLLNFLVQFIVPVIEAQIGWGHTFCMFLIIMIFAALHIHYRVPETKGMTLEEIEQKLHHSQKESGEPTETTGLV